MNARQRGMQQELYEMFKVSRELWHPTVQNLRTYPVPINDHRKERLRDTWLETWLGFGAQFGFHEQMEK
jgi:hypothetical protein